MDWNPYTQPTYSFSLQSCPISDNKLYVNDLLDRDSERCEGSSFIVLSLSLWRVSNSRTVKLKWPFELYFLSLSLEKSHLMHVLSFLYSMHVPCTALGNYFRVIKHDPKIKVCLFREISLAIWQCWNERISFCQTSKVWSTVVSYHSV